MEDTTAFSTLAPAELLSLANEFNTLGGTYFAMYLTLVSGYLVAAYLAGANLTRGQVRLVNGMFTLSSIYFVWSTMTMWLAGVSIYLEAADEEWKRNLYVTAGLNLLLTIAMIVGIIASLHFMHGVRTRANREN